MATGTRRAAVDTATTRVTVGVLVVLVLAVVAALVQSGGAAGPGPSSPLRPAAVPLDRRVPVATPLGASSITGLDIASIGLASSEILPLGLREDTSLDVPSDASHIGWYERGASPGTVGPAVMAAHVNYRGEDGAFARLRDVRPGDVVEVHREDGVTAVFEVSRIDEYSKNAFPTEAVYGPTDAPELRLITCGGTFDPARRSYEDNIVVSATLAGAYRAG